LNTTEKTISEKSIWLSATPTEFARDLPFYVVEAGFFLASAQYFVERQETRGYLFLYTVKKYGTIEQNGEKIILPEQQAIIIDCSKSHCYYAGEEGWDFIWFWIEGNGVETIYNYLYSQKIMSVNMQNNFELRTKLPELVQKVTESNVKGYTSLSADIHYLLNAVLAAALEHESVVQKKDYSKDIEQVLEFIKLHYGKQISLEDMIRDIHISKYHFIRLFKRVMGVTPYHYLTTYRINDAKTMLCTTEKSVADISVECGFLDTSQLFKNFRKYVGMKPLQYRAYFKQYL